jgi:chromate transporter
MAFSLVYVLWGQTALVDGLFLGLKAAVIALVIQALIRVGRRAVRSATAFTLAALAFIAIAFLDAPFPLIIAAAALFGYLWTRSGRREFLTSANAHGGTGSASPPPIVDQAALTRVGDSHVGRTGVRLQHTPQGARELLDGGSLDEST